LKRRLERIWEQKAEEQRQKSCKESEEKERCLENQREFHPEHCNICDQYGLCWKFGCYKEPGANGMCWYIGSMKKKMYCSFCDENTSVGKMEVHMMDVTMRPYLNTEKFVYECSVCCVAVNTCF